MGLKWSGHLGMKAFNLNTLRLHSLRPLLGQEAVINTVWEPSIHK